MTDDHKTDLTSYYLQTPMDNTLWELFEDECPSLEDEEYWAMMEGLIGECMINGERL